MLRAFRRKYLQTHCRTRLMLTRSDGSLLAIGFNIALLLSNLNFVSSIPILTTFLLFTHFGYTYTENMKLAVLASVVVGASAFTSAPAVSFYFKVTSSIM